MLLELEGKWSPKNSRKCVLEILPNVFQKEIIFNRNIYFNLVFYRSFFTPECTT